MFRLFLEGDGSTGPMGVKSIADWLNTRGFRNGQDKPFYVGTVHRMLTRESYTGVHHYNCQDSRTHKARPENEWVAIAIPPIIPAAEFQLVQAKLESRRPTVTPPRITNSQVLLTGLARCESCGGPLMVRTGKGGRYRYYACAGNRLRGRAACSNPIAVPERDLDRLVVTALVDRLLTPERLPTLQREAHAHRRAQSSGNMQRRSTLRRQLKETEAQIRRLYTALAEGTVSDTSLFRESLYGAESRRADTIRLLSLLEVETPSLRHALSKAQARTVATKLRCRLLEAPAPMQRRYIHGLVGDVLVDREKAVISGPSAVLAAAVTAGSYKSEVRRFVREWRREQSAETLLRH